MRTIVVASGKGGTGKTTLTALFAHFASDTGRVAVADADVEASNLPIALDVQAESCEAFRGGSKAIIDPDVCTGCGACEQVCRFGALSFDPETLAFVVDPWACEGCGFCVHVCPVGAVRLKESAAGEACIGVSSIGPMAFGQLGPGEDLSGRLVSEVRRLAIERAERHGADWLLIDGPPGIGCPTIAAVTNTDMLVAVAEPTMSGEHDLDRLTQLAARFQLPVVVALNKADLSEEGAERIRRYCREHKLELIAEIPFDPAVAAALATLAACADGSPVLRPSSGIDAIERAWERVSASHARSG